MDNDSLAQPTPLSTLSGIFGELEGTLEVPDRPKLAAGYANIYHGIFLKPQGERVEVAVKEIRGLIPNDIDTDWGERDRRIDERMMQEVLVWNQRKHPNLYPLLGYCSQPQPRLVSPWSRHGNLSNYLAANSGLSELDKLQLIYQVGRGLEHLHSQTPPICYAGVKPQNVLINDHLEAALSDFCFSRVLTDLGKTGGSIAGVVFGENLNYAAGELYAGERPSPETDVYAFGGLILRAMSGKPPFYGLTPGRVLQLVVGGQLPEPQDHPKLPASDPLWSLMRSCWNRTPAGRPTMGAVVQQLRDCVSHEELKLRMSRPGSADLPSSVSEFHETQELTPSEKLHMARIKFTGLEAQSKDIPVSRNYIRAAAAIGLVLIEIAQIVDKDEEITNSLASHIWKLAILLEGLNNWSSSHPGLREETAPHIAEISSTRSRHVDNRFK
ncbi:hypothetical protein FRC01_011347 [Tulasnella sp. 417]|nr:hypothetical protein FRC01_011347 [Tulasnella sp. 417]